MFQFWKFNSHYGKHEKEYPFFSKQILRQTLPIILLEKVKKGTFLKRGIYLQNSPYIYSLNFQKRGAQKQKKAPHYNLMKTLHILFWTTVQFFDSKQMRTFILRI